jgi:hypothetical protein
VVKFLRTLDTPDQFRWAETTSLNTNTIHTTLRYHCMSRLLLLLRIIDDRFQSDKGLYSIPYIRNMKSSLQMSKSGVPREPISTHTLL